MAETTGRGSWSSNVGFILAGAGSAIGLGAIWRFPYITGANGGAIFVVVFLACCFMIGYPVMVAELSLGRHTEKNPMGMFRKLSGRPLWKGIGGLCVLSGFVIFSWYSVIAAWVLGYLYKAAMGAFSQVRDPAAISQVFSEFVGDAPTVIFLHAMVVLVTAYVVFFGVKAGIERLSRWLMPVLFILLVLLAVRSVTLPGSYEGLVFYLKPDLSKVSGGMILAAMGQALFSLSLGMGTMITYGSYLSKKANIPVSAAWITFFEVLVCLLAGLVIMPAVSAMGKDFAAGPKLIFEVLPSVFAEMPGGYMFGIGFFVLVIIAALTSTVSIVEVPVAYFVDEKRWSRRKAVVFVSCVAFAMGMPTALAHGANEFLSRLPAIETDFFTAVSTIFGDISLSIGSLFIAIFAAWVWGVKRATQEIESQGIVFKVRRFWGFLIKYVAPVTILIIFINVILSTFFGR